MLKIFFMRLIRSKGFWSSFILLIGIGWIYIDSRREIAYLNMQLTNSQRAGLEQRKKDSLAIVKEVKKVKELEGVILTQTKMTAQWKDLYFDIKGVKQDTTPTGSIQVSFEEESECASVWGFTETATEKDTARAVVLITHKSIDYYIDYFPVGNKIYGYVRADKACVKIEDVGFSVPPSLFIKKRGGKSGLFWFVVGGATGVSLLYILSN